MTRLGLVLRFLEDLYAEKRIYVGVIGIQETKYHIDKASFMYVCMRACMHVCMHVCIYFIDCQPDINVCKYKYN